MQNFKPHQKTIERRVNFLDKKVATSSNRKSLSWDKSELSSLKAFLRVGKVYEDARSKGGSHLENILFMARDVIEEVLEEDRADLADEAIERLESAHEKLVEGIELIHRISEE